MHTHTRTHRGRGRDEERMKNGKQDDKKENKRIRSARTYKHEVREK